MKPCRPKRRIPPLPKIAATGSDSSPNTQRLLFQFFEQPGHHRPNRALVTSRPEIPIDGGRLVDSLALNDRGFGQRMHGKLTARRYARLLEHHTGSAMADHDLIPTGELPDHFHQIEIVRLAGMPGEHGHGIMRKCRPWPYEELVHAVMMLRAPGLPAGKRVKSFVQSVDVAPTVCEWLGLGVHPDMQGKSLLALARGEVEKVRDFAIAGYYRYSWSIITDEWSYIHWIKDDEKSVAESMFEIYGKGTLASSSHLGDNPLGQSSECTPMGIIRNV